MFLGSGQVQSASNDSLLHTYLIDWLLCESIIELSTVTLSVSKLLIGEARRVDQAMQIIRAGIPGGR